MKILKVLFLLAVAFGLLSCSTNQKKAPKAVNGVLDLRGWDFEKDGIVRLDGDWEFYWKQFLSAKDFDTVKKKHFIAVPKPWNEHEMKANKFDNEILPPFGYASYKLKVLIKSQTTKKLSMKMPDQGTAYELYLENSLIAKTGKIGKTRETYKPEYKQFVIPLSTKSDTLSLVCLVSNYEFHYGGLYFSITLGDGEIISNIRQKAVITDFCVTIVQFALSLIFFMFFILRPKEKASFLMSIICLMTAVRNSTIYEKIITIIFPNLNWELLIKLEGLSWMVFSVLVAFYLRQLYKKNTSLIFIISISIFFGIIGLATIILPARLNSYFIFPGQMGGSVFIVFIIYFSIKMVIKKVEGSVILLVGWIFITLGAFNDIYYFLGMIDLILPFTHGQLILCLSQLLLISFRFSNAYKRIENFAKELKLEVENKTKDLKLEKEKTEDLLKKSDSLLLNVLPEQIAERLKQGETTIADHFNEASVIFIDVADFTLLSAKSNPQAMVRMLNEIFTIFDKIAAKYGLEKIKTIGDCYMAASGIPVPREDYAESIAHMALDVMQTMENYRSQDGHEIKFRIGLDCGPIVAGVIGEQKFIYDLWGDMVNTASRMETNGIIGRIQCTERFKEKLTIDNGELKIKFEERGEIEVKGKGMMRTYFLISNDELGVRNERKHN